MEPIARGGSFLQKTEVIPLPAPDLPEKFSCALLPSSNSATSVYKYVGLPEGVALLDIFTFKLSDKTIKQAKPVKRQNGATGLDYSVKVLKWDSQSCELELTGSYNGKLAPVTFTASKLTTTLVHIHTAPQVSFAFTFLDSTSLVHSAADPDRVAGIRAPKRIASPAPVFPEELRRTGNQGMFAFLGIVNRQGKFDSSRWIVLECLHPLFVHSAVRTILEGWRFAPGQMGAQAVDILAVVEVDFRLFGK
jgi:hypothetical protein